MLFRHSIGFVCSSPFYCFNWMSTIHFSATPTSCQKLLYKRYVVLSPLCEITTYYYYHYFAHFLPQFFETNLKPMNESKANALIFECKRDVRACARVRPRVRVCMCIFASLHFIHFSWSEYFSFAHSAWYLTYNLYKTNQIVFWGFFFFLYTIQLLELQKYLQNHHFRNDPKDQRWCAYSWEKN